MKKSLATFGIFVTAICASFGWDYEGHRLVNEVALASLPANFPAFAKTPAAQDRIAFLAGEPDRWRNTPELALQHEQEPEHFMDIEELAACGLTPQTLPEFRYDFITQVGAAHKAHPELFPAGRADPAHKFVWGGLLPWALTEDYARLKSGFSYLKALEENGTPEEIANAQQNIIYMMGIMGHYAGDAAQPLHTTIHHHGWVGANPKHYATNSSIHGWIDGGYIRKVGINIGELRPKVKPAGVLPAALPNSHGPDIFQTVVAFVVEQHKQLEPLYELNKNGSLSDHGEAGSKGRAFIDQQLLAGGQFLGNLWVSAWQSAPPDTFLKSQLAHRKADQAAHKSANP